MRFMVMGKATKESEAGILPNREIIGQVLLELISDHFLLAGHHLRALLFGFGLCDAHVGLRLIRLELYGEHGGPVLAGKLQIPSRTWANYERGVTIPGETLLEFLVLTGVEPTWLLRGAGEKYRVATP